MNFGENCANAFPDANLDPSQPEEAQAFCQNNMLLDGQVFINSSSGFGKRYNCSVKLDCDTRFQHVFTACGRVFKVISLV
jgi:hypothetical protein